MRPPRTAITLLLLLVLAACAGGAAATATVHRLPVVSASERQDGGTVTLRKGQRLRVVLHSTYWQLAGSSDRGVLLPQGAPRVQPQPSGCVVGQGCGTVTAWYVARALGRAEVSGSRTSCGEAMGCTAASGSYTLHVVVRRAG